MGEVQSAPLQSTTLDPFPHPPHSHLVLERHKSPENLTAVSPTTFFVFLTSLWLRLRSHVYPNTQETKL